MIIINTFVKFSLIVAGFIFLALGILGIFLPLLPTTVFLLLAAACFAKSSEKLYERLLSNRWLGQYIKNYREGKGIPMRAKILSVSTLWLTIGYSIFIINRLPIRIMLGVIAVAVTIHVLTIKTLRNE